MSSDESYADILRAAADLIEHHAAHTYTPHQMSVSLWLSTNAVWLREVADLHEARVDGPGCQWCNDEDWPCADMRHAYALALAFTRTEGGSW